MTQRPFDKRRFLSELILDIDTVAATARQDLAKLNQIARILAIEHGAGKMSDLHYTVDKERLNRTMNNCKKLLWSLSKHRTQAVKLLNE